LLGKKTLSCIPNNEEQYISFLKSIKVDEYNDKDGNIKCFGINTNDNNIQTNTILPLILFVPFIAILSYLIILIIEMIYT
jgi:hypothetical protein